MMSLLVSALLTTALSLQKDAQPLPKPLWEAKAHTSTVLGLAYSPKGDLLASGSHDMLVKVWQASSGTLRHSLKGHQGAVWDVTFSPDGRLLASSGPDRTVRLWDPETGKELAVLRGHTREIAALSFSPKGDLLASGGGHPGGLLHLWDLKTRTVKKRLDEAVNTIACDFSPDGSTLACASLEGVLTLWDVATGKRLLRRETKGRASSHIEHVGDGTRLLTSGSMVPNSEKVVLRHSKTLEILLTVDAHEYVQSTHMIPDGTLLATAGFTGFSKGMVSDDVSLWDGKTGKRLAALKKPGAGVTRIRFSPDGSALAIADRKGTLRIVDIRAFMPEK